MARKGFPKRIMVVEDDAVLGLEIEQALLDHGVAEVSLCPSASCTLGKLREGSFDAVVLDVHLADSDDGWEIAELVKALGGDSARIVFQTGAPQDIPDRIQKLGPVLSKPYPPEALIAALQSPRKPGLLERLRRGQRHP